MNDYLPLLTMGVLAAIFAAGSFLASGLLGTKRPHPAKTAPYESGIVPTNEPAERFPVRFYLVAMIFIIFDIEIIFIYPWAVIFDELRLFGLIEMVVFALAVLVSFAYLLSNGALDWGPAKRMQVAITPGGRTTESTIRRIGRDDTALAAPDTPVVDPVAPGAPAEVA